MRVSRKGRGKALLLLPGLNRVGASYTRGCLVWGGRGVLEPVGLRQAAGRRGLRSIHLKHHHILVLAVLLFRRPCCRGAAAAL